jgi:hypothetical protein
MYTNPLLLPALFTSLFFCSRNSLFQLFLLLVLSMLAIEVLSLVLISDMLEVASLDLRRPGCL